MKIKQIATGFLLTLLSACSDDFIDIPPQTFLSSATFFKSQEDFTQAINGAYAPLRSLYSNAWVIDEMRSDNTFYDYNTSDRGGQNVEFEQIDNFLDNSNNRYTANKWNSNYNIISRANQILAQIEAVTFDETAKNNIKGQALFLRAFAYFDLAQHFGAVPLHLKPAANEAEALVARTPEAEVYAQLLADATAAASLLPAVQTDKGRVTRGAAKTLLGYVYLTLKRYPEAETQLKEVTQLGYALLPDYAAVFDPANKNSTESILEVQYLQGTQGQQSNFIYFFIPRLTDTKVITGVTGNNQTSGGWNVPTDDLLATYEPGDARKAASLAEGYTDASGTFVAKPYIRKYLHPHANFNNTDDNWPIYRYADVLLLLAEALNAQGKPAEALPYLNQVRKRAGLITDITETNPALLAAIILHERRVELAFENKRWPDLIRSGKAVDIMTAHGAAQKQKYAFLLPQAYEVIANKFLLPIPEREIILNTQLNQNPGY